MAGSFSTLNTALSALRYQQATLDITSTNIANASTEGYVRRRIVGQTVGAAAAPAVWSRSSEIGSGVVATGVDRLVDPLLDTRVRREHARQTYLDLKSAALQRVETGIAEPSDNGVAKALDTFKNSLDDLNNAPGSDAARSQVLANAAVVADAFNIQAHNIHDELGDQRARVLASVQEVNDVAAQLAATNETIAQSRGGGSDVATLMDVRDRLALRLSELTGATAKVNSSGGMDVELDGASLVSGSSHATLQITGGVNPDGTAGPGPVTFQLQPPGAVPPVALAGLAGDLGASAELIDVDLPDYLEQLNTLVASFADALNTAHAAGYDAAGDPGGPLFSYDPLDPASTVAVAITTGGKLAVSSIPGGGLDTGNAHTMADAITIQDGYQRLVNGFGSKVASIERLASNQRSMSTQVDTAREQLAGVSIDEETVNMVLAQRSYEAAARVMTAVDEMLDTLINRTGTVGR